QQTESALGRVQRHQRLVDECTKEVDDVVRLQVIAGADALGGGEGEAVSEDGAAPQQRALAVVQQIEAPVERRRERLLARPRVTRPTSEEAEAVIEPADDLCGGEMTNTCRGELDRERYSVETFADLRHRGGRVRGRFEAGIGGGSPLHEQSVCLRGRE